MNFWICAEFNVFDKDSFCCIFSSTKRSPVEFLRDIFRKLVLARVYNAAIWFSGLATSPPLPPHPRRPPSSPSAAPPLLPPYLPLLSHLSLPPSPLSVLPCPLSPSWNPPRRLSPEMLWIFCWRPWISVFVAVNFCFSAVNFSVNFLFHWPWIFVWAAVKLFKYCFTA